MNEPHSQDASSAEDSCRRQPTVRERLTLIRFQQCRDWGEGQRLFVEAYLDRFPALRNNPEAILDLIYNEIILREERGEDVRLQDYQERFPLLASELRCLFDAHQAMDHDLGSNENPTVLQGGAPTGGSAVEPVVEGARPAIPGYEVLGRLGQGGMGVVYKARQISINRLVALKMIRGQHGPEEWARFRREAELAASLRHPHIVKIFDFGEMDGQPYLTMEFVEGGSLEQRLDRKPASPTESAQLVELLARAMETAHQAKIIHRDLKPANVLLSHGDTRPSVADDAATRLTAYRYDPKITDFGLAKLLDSKAGQTASGLIMGTPGYMAPEQAAGHSSAVGPRADIYSLGVILYEMLTGRPPFQAARDLDLLEQVRSLEPVRPRSLQPRLPRDLETICLKCLQKEPLLRYPSAQALADDLRRYLDGLPIHARPVHAWERAWKRARRRPAASALVTLLTVAFLALPVALLLRQVEERRRLDALREEVRPVLDAGRAALDRREWGKALAQHDRAADRIKAEPALADLTEQAAAIFSRANRQQQAEQDYAAFQKKRDDALFLLQGLQFSAVPVPANLAGGQARAREALSLVGLGGDTCLPTLDPAFSPQEQQEILNGCCELALVLAERTAGAAEALQVLGPLVKLDPSIRVFHERRAALLAKTGAPAEAALARARSLDADRAVDHFLAGEASYRGADLAQAIDHFDAALRQQPEHFWAQHFRAVSLLRLGGRTSEAVAGLTTSLGYRNDFVWTYLLRGLAHGQLNAGPAAERDFDQALKLCRNDDAETRAVRYVLLVNRGVLRLGRRQLPEARADLQAAANLQPSRYEALVNLAQVHSQRKDWQQAIGQLTQALKCSPPDAGLLRNNLAVLYLEVPNLEAALHYVQQALDLDRPGQPGSQRVRHLLLLGQVQYRRKHYLAAVRAYEEALRLDRQYRPARLGLAEALLKLARHREAAVAYDEYFDQQPDAGEPALRRADAYKGRGQARMKLAQPDYPGALDDYNRAVLLGAAPAADLYLHRGWAYYFSKAYDLALADFLWAACATVEARIVSEARTGAGLCLANLGKYQQAVQDAEQLRPDTSEMVYNQACIFGLAVAQVKKALPLGHQALAAHYRGQAIERLRQSLKMLGTPAEQWSFWKMVVETDDALDSLHKDPGFLQLKDEVERQAKGSPK